MDKEKLATTIGGNLKKYRNAAGLTQEQLAERAGISTSFCANIERGHKGVSPVVLMDLADALGITVNHLLYEDNADGRLKNIELLLQGKPEPVIALAEKLICTCIESLPDTPNA